MPAPRVARKTDVDALMRFFPFDIVFYGDLSLWSEGDMDGMPCLPLETNTPIWVIALWCVSREIVRLCALCAVGRNKSSPLASVPVPSTTWWWWLNLILSTL